MGLSIQDVLVKSDQLIRETATNSIPPARVGELIYALAELLEQGVGESTSVIGGSSLSDLDDVELLSAKINDILQYSGGKWRNVSFDIQKVVALTGWWKLDANGNLYTDKNLYSNQGVSAYGMGASSGGGTVSVYDGLDSTSTTLALSANQGRILKAQIDALGTGGSGSISESDPIWSAQKQGYYTKSEVDSLISGVSGGGEGTTVSWGTEASGYVPLSVAGTSKNISLATHTHAWNDIANKPNTFTPTAHTHSISQISNLQLALDGKAALSHTHTVSDIQYFPTTWDWNNIDGKPSIYPPAAHTHTFASLTSKPTTLSGYGITDAVTLTTEQTISGAKTFTSAVNFGNGFSLETSTDELLLKHNGSIRHRFGKNGDILALADITAYSGNATASSRLEMSGDLDMNGHSILDASVYARELTVFGGVEHSYLYVGDENLSIYNNDQTGENRIDMGAVILSSKNGIGQVFSNQLIFRQGTIDKFTMYTESDRLYIKFGNTPIGYFQSNGLYSSI